MGKADVTQHCASDTGLLDGIDNGQVESTGKALVNAAYAGARVNQCRQEFLGQNRGNARAEVGIKANPNIKYWPQIQVNGRANDGHL